MAVQKFTAAEVLDMLENVQDDDLDHYHEELEQESGDESPAFGDYTDEDGQQVLVDSDLLHPSVTSSLRRQNEDVLPCEMDSLLLCDAELRDDDVVDSDTSSAEDEPVLDIGDQTNFSASIGSESSEPETVPGHQIRGGQRRGRGRGQSRGRGRGQRLGRGRGRGQSHSVEQGPESENQSSGEEGENESLGEEQNNQSTSRERNAAWRWSPNKMQVPNSTIVYADKPSPKGDSLNSNTPLDFFELFLDNDMVDRIVEETNRYACQERSAQNHLSPWSEVAREDILAFISMNIAMGIISLPSIRDYWSNEPLMAHPWFGTVMSRNRFQQILRYFHIVDNSIAQDRASPGYDKLWKIRPLIDQINRVSQANFTLGREVSIDESMIGTKARISFLQYLPKKPTKWGVKVWVLSDSKTSYIYNFKIYTGKDGNIIANGLAYNVVYELMAGCNNKGHYLYVDNFYTSPQLFHDLQKDGTYCSGTARINRRNFPKELKRQRREKSTRDDIKTLYHDSITAVRWFDKRDVLMLSTIFQNETVIADRRSGHSVLSITCPKIVSDYNAFMGGVDAADQHMMYYSCGRKGIKFWRRITWRLLDQVVLNSHVLYNLLQEQKCKTLLTQKQYRITLAYALAAPMHLMVRGPGRSPRMRNLDRLKGKHFATNKQPRKRCAVCAKKKTPTGKVKDTKTSNYCQKCDVYLCKGRCFQRFHTLVKY